MSTQPISTDVFDEEEQLDKFREIAEVMGASRNGSGEAVAKVKGPYIFIYPLNRML